MESAGLPTNPPDATASSAGATPTGQSGQVSVSDIRQEFADLRAEIAASRAAGRVPPAPAVAAPTLSPEERLDERLREIANFSHYCPGCGKLYNYLRECTGKSESPHSAIEVVPTDELSGDPTNHTPAPAAG